MPQNTGLQPLELRLDLWLWRARFFKSRSRCARQIKRGKIRVLRHGKTTRPLKPHFVVYAGDQLVFMRGDELVQIEIFGIGTRRPAAPEAHSMYKPLNLCLDTAAKYPMSA